MRRTIGVFLVLYGLAHAGAGMWLVSSAPIWIVTALWWVAITGFVAAGTGLLGVPPLDRHWRLLSSIGAFASIALISMSSIPVLMIGAAIDGAILLDAIPFVHREVVRLLDVPVHLTIVDSVSLGESFRAIDGVRHEAASRITASIAREVNRSRRGIPDALSMIAYGGDIHSRTKVARSA
jgi:signal transduction histidine kinase